MNEGFGLPCQRESVFSDVYVISSGVYVVCHVCPCFNCHRGRVVVVVEQTVVGQLGSGRGQLFVQFENLEVLSVRRQIRKKLQ